jgi:hypothetical protein
MLNVKDSPKKSANSNLLPIFMMAITTPRVLVEGEEAELYKTFYSDQSIALPSADQMPCLPLNSRSLMPIKTFYTTTRRITMPKHGILSLSRASS